MIKITPLEQVMKSLDQHAKYVAEEFKGMCESLSVLYCEKCGQEVNQHE